MQVVHDGACAIRVIARSLTEQTGRLGYLLRVARIPRTNGPLGQSPATLQRFVHEIIIISRHVDRQSQIGQKGMRILNITKIWPRRASQQVVRKTFLDIHPAAFPNRGELRHPGKITMLVKRKPVLPRQSLRQITGNRHMLRARASPDKWRALATTNQVDSALPRILIKGPDQNSPISNP